MTCITFVLITNALFPFFLSFKKCIPHFKPIVLLGQNSQSNSIFIFYGSYASISYWLHESGSWLICYCWVIKNDATALIQQFHMHCTSNPLFSVIATLLISRFSCASETYPCSFKRFISSSSFTALQCTGDFPTSMLLPIIIGCALGGLIVVVLLIYCFFRARMNKNYDPVHTM